MSSAIWMMPRDSVYGGWPASGELDIMESKGNQEWTNSIGSTLHWGPDWSQNRWYLTHFDATIGESFHNAFHNFQVEWTDDHIKFSVDNNEMGTISPPGGGFWELGGFDGNSIWGSRMGPFDQPFYFILNVAVGGTNGFFADGGNKPWSNGSPSAKDDFWNARGSWQGTWNDEEAALQVDYIHVFAV